MNKCEDGHIYVNYDKNEIHFNAGINDDSMIKLIDQLLSMEIKIKKECKSLKRKLAQIESIDEKTTDTKLNKNTSNNFDDDNVNYIFKIEPKPIKLYITSHGGSIYQVFSVIDTIKQITIPVHTIVKGIAASAGTLLSLAGSKRFITKNSYMLIHELRSGSWGKYSFLKDNYDNCTNLMEHIKNYYIENTKLTKEDLDIQLVKDLTWNATTCLEKGLVDEIIL
jgi:ATP-dependent protease ClpP protease subunit